eukprot:TRINITY_DN1644_c0_g1_i1.p2 TRINITY_DN1644_c0_g1~~TRINITY_DN1644_c0_g1_i1.p2  ORF type:complete len:102 (+),score=29.93 TRINITY_DN1644_c0_g1_i1:2-307(+)
MSIQFFFFQAEDGIRDFCLSRGLGDVYKRQQLHLSLIPWVESHQIIIIVVIFQQIWLSFCNFTCFIFKYQRLSTLFIIFFKYHSLHIQVDISIQSLSLIHI